MNAMQRREAERQTAEWRVAATLAMDWSEVKATWTESGLSPVAFSIPNARTAVESVLKVAGGGGGMDDDAVWYGVVEELNGRGEVEVVEELARRQGAETTPLFFASEVKKLKRFEHDKQAADTMRDILRREAAGEDVVEEKKRLAGLLAEVPTVERRLHPLHVVSAGDLLAADIPPRVDIIGEAVVFGGAVSALVGAGGTGKSRIVVQLAIHSLVGLDFGPLHVPKLAAGSWLLLIGNENSRRRIHGDISRMLDALALTPEQREEVGRRLFVHVLDGPDDALTPEGIGRIVDTVKATDAAVVVIDPLGDVIDGDANSDSDVRRTLAAVQSSARTGNPDSAVFLVHHSRDGAQNLRQAYGWDGGNFGKGSKAVRNCCRAMVHVVVRSPDDADGGVVFVCGKSNDARKFEPFGMTFDGGAYFWDRDFDFEAWKAGLNAAAEGKTLPTVGEVVDGRVKVTTAGVLQTVKAEEWQHFTAATVADALKVTKRTVQRHLDALVRDGVLTVTKGRNPSEASRYTLTQDTIP